MVTINRYILMRNRYIVMINRYIVEPITSRCVYHDTKGTDKGVQKGPVV